MVIGTALKMPTRIGSAVFEAKATILRVRRMAREVRAREKAGRLARGSVLRDAPVIAYVTSPLWSRPTGPKDYALTAGKVHNLRLAIRLLDGLEGRPGEVFSFWKEIGRTTRWRGFVKGRELREGCLIPSIGGGLCQLSNALYEAAVGAGFEIVERHAHSRAVPGSRAAEGLDATVFWNYVDLRFRSNSPFRIEAGLRYGKLEVRIRSWRNGRRVLPLHALGNDRRPNDCLSCEETECHLHDSDSAIPMAEVPTAWLLDCCWPEFAKLLREKGRPSDVVFVPQRLRKSARHAWPEGVAGAERRATMVAARRALALRRTPQQGRALQQTLMRYDEAIAKSYARRLSHLHTHIVLSLPLLPHLWRIGVLAGRTFDVLMERAPMSVLESALDKAARLFRDSATLADFRAPKEIAEAEAEALRDARFLYTPHRGIAALDPARTILLDWEVPTAVPRATRGGRTVLFPASGLARKGAYVLREALEGFNVELVITGRVREAEGFWRGLTVREASEWPTSVAAVVLPALVEHQPRALLRAIAAGLPVIATAECGLGEMPGLTPVPAYDVSALRTAIAGVLPQS
jgi:hypothetical protein